MTSPVWEPSMGSPVKGPRQGVPCILSSEGGLQTGSPGPWSTEGVRRGGPQNGSQKEVRRMGRQKGVPTRGPCGGSPERGPQLGYWGSPVGRPLKGVPVEGHLCEVHCRWSPVGDPL
jgi:hypothetical protein